MQLKKEYAPDCLAVAAMVVAVAAQLRQINAQALRNG
jgi:hypothetical protein